MSEGVTDPMGLAAVFNRPFTNCTYTTSNGANTQVSLDAVMKVAADLPIVPKIMTMDISMMRNSLLPDNWIMLSDTVADALEKAMKEASR